MKTKIFISHCSEDIKKDDPRLSAFLKALDDAGKGTYEIIIDYYHKDASIGSNLEDFMQQIYLSDAVIILLTPGYNERITNKRKCGANNEFEKILYRWKKTTDNKTYGLSFLVLPILFFGNFENCCPDEIKNIHCDDLNWLHTIPQEKVRGSNLRSDDKKKLKKFAGTISSRIDAITVTKSHEFKENEEKLYKKFLFEDTKSRWYEPENHRYLESIFVKTSAFSRAVSKQINFIVGRKGSGKSSIIHVLPTFLQPSPSTIIDIDFEDFPYYASYNIFRFDPAVESDINNFFSPIESYKFIWDLFFHLVFAWNVRNYLPNNSLLMRQLKKLVGDIDKRKCTTTEELQVITKTLFSYAFEKLNEFINEEIRNLDSSKPLASIFANFTPSRFREKVLTPTGVKYLKEIFSKYRSSGEKVLVVADGFDSKYGFFVKSNIKNFGASIFQRDLLLALFQTVMDNAANKKMSSEFYSITNFCIAIPQERFLEIREYDRDRYQYRHRFDFIHWTGIELSALVRKRLVELRKIKDPKFSKNGNLIVLEERLNYVMENGYPELPKEIIFTFGKNNYRIPLFLYVLRHTFWRPRDILYYYSALLTASERFKNNKISMDSGFARQIIAGATRYIIEDECINEFEPLLLNIRQILNKFRNENQELSWDVIKSKLDDTNFISTTNDFSDNSIEWKVELLYDIGFLGIVVCEDYCERFSSHRHAFFFNEADLLYNKVGRDSYPGLRFIIHPLFVEYLNLNTKTNSELILLLDWKYLHINDDLTHALPIYV